ncbi:hypothetical protein [Planomicrobium sp. YIM 101495]|nr:hypothetical protein [Planomicrobium sp. YIM 101495]
MARKQPTTLSGWKRKNRPILTKTANGAEAGFGRFFNLDAA